MRALIELRHPRGLDRFVRSVSDPRSPRYRHYATSRSWSPATGRSRGRASGCLRWLAARGLRGTVDRRRHLRAGARSAGAPGRAPDAARRGRAPGTAAARTGREVPAALRRGGDADLAARHEPAARRRRRRRPPQRPSATAREEAAHPLLLDPQTHRHRVAAARPAAAPSSRPAIEPFTPNQYLTAYGLAAMHAKGLEGPGPDGRHGRGRRLQAQRHRHLRPLLRDRKPPPIKVVRRSAASEAAARRRRADARPLDARRSALRS